MATTKDTMVTSRTQRWLYSSLVLASFLAVFFAAIYTTLKLRVAFADGQVAIFRATKVAAATTTDINVLKDQLNYVVNYYPSGSRQVRGTQLDRVVESARSNTIETIIDRLRTTTGRDLGKDPQQWLREYP